MNRKIEFEPELCLDKAVDVFTRNGYSGTSLSMLTDALDIGRQSLYNTFGDKKTLLSAAIARAAETFPGAVALNNPQLNGRQAIEGFFAAVLAQCANPMHPGCLVSNLLLEKGLSDEEIREQVQARWLGTRLALKKTCQRGLKDGSVTNGVSADVMADALMVMMSGLRVSARAGIQPLALKKVVTASIQSLLSADEN
jgi:TetR/AcrR family transcriptional regulator, transcriptional repressor for nem operon